MPRFKYRGARALVILHEQALRRFLDMWRKAKACGVILPQTGQRKYASLDALLYHLYESARRYMIWMCEVLQLPDPHVMDVPHIDSIDAQAEHYLEHLLDRWREPLAGVSKEQFSTPEYPAWWGTRYCVDAMLEHAVMHPIRHRFQLVELADQQGKQIVRDM